MTEQEIMSASREIGGRIENIFAFASMGLSDAVKAFGEFGQEEKAKQDILYPNFLYVDRVAAIIRKHTKEKRTLKAEISDIRKEEKRQIVRATIRWMLNGQPILEKQWTSYRGDLSKGDFYFDALLTNTGFPIEPLDSPLPGLMNESPHVLVPNKDTEVELLGATVVAKEGKK